MDAKMKGARILTRSDHTAHMMSIIAGRVLAQMPLLGSVFEESPLTCRHIRWHSEQLTSRSAVSKASGGRIWVRMRDLDAADIHTRGR